MLTKTSNDKNPTEINGPLELFGWFGAFAILSAYSLASFSIVAPDSICFQLLNALGAFGVATVSLKKRAYQPAVLNVVWFIVAVIAFIKIVIDRLS